MGSRQDPDAALLEDVASKGNGRVYFAEDVLSLPRIFSQETIAVARSTFIDTATPLVVGADLALLGRLPVSDSIRLGGYNLTYLRSQASVGLRTDDENKAPTVAFWPRGAGRAVAFTGEVDGEYTGDFKAWNGRRALLEQMVRWTLPATLDPLEAVPRATVQGNNLHVTLDFEPSAPLRAVAPTLVILSGDARSKPIEIPMRWEDEDRIGAHFTLPAPDARRCRPNATTQPRTRKEERARDGDGQSEKANRPLKLLPHHPQHFERERPKNLLQGVPS